MGECKICNSKPKGTPSVADIQSPPSGKTVAKGSIDYSAKALICQTCPFSSNGWRCRVADMPCQAIHATEKPCPLNKFPDSEGRVKFVGLSWNGVPMPMRIVNELHAEKVNKKIRKENKTLPQDKQKKEKVPQSRYMKGCGCLAWLKDFSDNWKTQGILKAAVAKGIEWVAPKGAFIFAYALMAFLASIRLPDTFFNVLWRNKRRKRVLKEQGEKKVTKEQLADISSVVREAVTSNANVKDALDAYHTAHASDTQTELENRQAELSNFREAIADGGIYPTAP